MMNIVIIEDEVLTARDLADILRQQAAAVRIVKILSSVSEAVSWFRENECPDLVYSDIQLGDGQSFEIFRQQNLQCPVIFCTAYNEFALDAFRNNGIDYILKPFSAKTIQQSIEKYSRLRGLNTDNTPYNGHTSALPAKPEQIRKNGSILINWKDKIIPVKIADIALFTIDYKMTQLVTFDNQHYFLNQTLEELEQTCGPAFYRANRQYLVNKDSILEALQYFARKLVLKLKVEGGHEVIISKNRVPDFLEWLKE